MCSDRCLAVIGGERHLLNLNEIFVDSENPCERFMCKVLFEILTAILF